MSANQQCDALVEELSCPLDSAEYFRRLYHQPYCIFLDSRMQHDEVARYSFLAVDPFEVIRCAADGQDSLTHLATRLDRFPVANLPNLPPFQGGAAGLFSYDLGRSLERVPRPKYEEFLVPGLAIGLYDIVLAFDHLQDRAWIISQGLPEPPGLRRRRRAERRLRWFKETLNRSASTARQGSSHTDVNRADKLPLHRLARQYPVDEVADLTSNFNPDQYQRAVQRVIDYIHAGDVFQVNLSQRLLYPAKDEPIDLYFRLRERNPAPFAGYFDIGSLQIISASPERFLSVRDRRVEARPIKGTRQRTARPEADLFAATELQESEKDRAENVMIVDLMRNDLARVAEPDSVRVTQLCQLESYQYVQHLVSAVEGQLDSAHQPLEVVQAAFPGGSITGAPKIRAMEIIAELEPTARGAYCGSLGYVGFNGSLDLSILIRTITCTQGWWQLPVGGGVVAASVPRHEYEETWHKALGMVRALT